MSEIKVLDGDGNTKYYNTVRTGATGDSFLPIPADLYAEIVAGNVPKYSIVQKFGRNNAVPNASWEGVLQASAQFNFLTVAEKVQIQAGGHANDTAAGTGAQAVTVEGLDDTGAFVSESIELAGAAESAPTTALFWRVFKAYITDLRAGTYGGANAADIMVENDAGAVDLIAIVLDEGQSQYGAYAIPLAKTGYLLSIAITVDAAKAINVRLYTRESLTDFTTPYAPKRLRNYWDGVVSGLTIKPKSPLLVLPALTDIWFEAYGDGAISEISIEFEILLIDD